MNTQSGKVYGWGEMTLGHGWAMVDWGHDELPIWCWAHDGEVTDAMELSCTYDEAFCWPLKLQNGFCRLLTLMQVEMSIIMRWNCMNTTGIYIKTSQIIFWFILFIWMKVWVNILGWSFYCLSNCCCLLSSNYIVCMHHSWHIKSRKELI